MSVTKQSFDEGIKILYQIIYFFGDKIKFIMPLDLNYYYENRYCNGMSLSIR